MYARLLLLLVVVVAVGFAPAPLPKRQREDKRTTLERAQGWWDIISERSYGNVGRNETSQLRLLVKDDTLTYYVGDHKADSWTITIDDNQRPPALDKMALGSAKGTKATFLGRLSVEGDVLKLCFRDNTVRPPDLRGDDSTAITFRKSFR